MLLLCPFSVIVNISLSYLTQLTVTHSMNGLECSGKAYKTFGQKSSTLKSEYGCTYCLHSPDNSPINNFISFGLFSGVTRRVCGLSSSPEISQQLLTVNCRHSFQSLGHTEKYLFAKSYLNVSSFLF